MLSGVRSKLSDLRLGIWLHSDFSSPVLIKLRRPHAHTNPGIQLWWLQQWNTHFCFIKGWGKDHRGQTTMAKQGQRVDIFQLNTMPKTLCDAHLKLRSRIKLCLVKTSVQLIMGKIGHKVAAATKQKHCQLWLFTHIMSKADTKPLSLFSCLFAKPKGAVVRHYTWIQMKACSVFLPGSSSCWTALALLLFLWTDGVKMQPESCRISRRCDRTRGWRGGRECGVTSDRDGSQEESVMPEGLSSSPFGKQMQEGEEIGSVLFIYPPTHVTRRLQVWFSMHWWPVTWGYLFACTQFISLKVAWL